MLRAVLLLVGGLSVCFQAAPGQAQKPLRSESVLPATTVGFASIENYDQLRDHWNQTQLGTLMADPVMEPFVKDVQKQFAERWAQFDERLGLTLEDLEGVPSGEIAVAAIQPGRYEAAQALLVDVTGHTDQAQQLLDKVSASLISDGAKRQVFEVLDTKVIVFDLPEPPAEEDAKLAPGVQEPEEVEAPSEPRRAIYFLTATVLGVSDNLDVIKGILSRLHAAGGESLAEVASFREVMKRCAKDAGRESAQFRWYVNPIPYAEVARAASPPAEPRRGKDMLDIFREQGFRHKDYAGSPGQARCDAGRFEKRRRAVVER